MENTTLYIAYGSNLNLEQMAHRCPTAKVAGASKLTGYQLRFRGRRHGAVATVEKKSNGSVPILLWEITPADEAALDRYEGWPHLYRKETVRVQLNGKTYIMNEGRPLGAPSPYYYNIIAQGIPLRRVRHQLQAGGQRFGDGIESNIASIYAKYFHIKYIPNTTETRISSWYTQLT